jgi:hypothetical protein
VTAYAAYQSVVRMADQHPSTTLSAAAGWRTFQAHAAFQRWANHHSLVIPLKFYIQHSITCGLILQKMPQPSVLTKYVQNALLQRVWDDLYDQGAHSLDALNTARQIILGGEGESDLPFVGPLRQLYRDLQQGAYSQSLLGHLQAETAAMVDGYEYEWRIQHAQPNADLAMSTYLQAASASIGVRFMVISLAAGWVRSEADYDAYLTALPLAQPSARIVRMVNDIGKHQQDAREGKVNLITVYSREQGLSAAEALVCLKQDLQTELDVFERMRQTLPQNPLVDVISRITWVTVQRYLKQQLS